MYFIPYQMSFIRSLYFDLTAMLDRSQLNIAITLIFIYVYIIYYGAAQHTFPVPKRNTIILCHETTLTAIKNFGIRAVERREIAMEQEHLQNVCTQIDV